MNGPFLTVTLKDLIRSCESFTHTTHLYALIVEKTKKPQVLAIPEALVKTVKTIFNHSRANL